MLKRPLILRKQQNLEFLWWSVCKQWRTEDNGCIHISSYANRPTLNKYEIAQTIVNYEVQHFLVHIHELLPILLQLQKLQLSIKHELLINNIPRTNQNKLQK